jgi:hypothetical protein
VTEKRLDGADVVVCLKKMGGEAVAENVGGDTLGKLGPSHCLIKSLLDVPAAPYNTDFITGNDVLSQNNAFIWNIFS